MSGTVGASAMMAFDQMFRATATAAPTSIVAQPGGGAPFYLYPRRNKLSPIRRNPISQLIRV